jgi:lipid A disaccharide synthetase
MRSAGCDVWVASEELAVMGLAEVVRHLPRLRRILLDLELRLNTDPPDLYIGIDAPDFNLRLERRLRPTGLRTLHYVSPSVGAWRPGRVQVLREACDHVLCLLPFEADFLHRHGVAVLNDVTKVGDEGDIQGHTIVGDPLRLVREGQGARCIVRVSTRTPSCSSVLSVG